MLYNIRKIYEISKFLRTKNPALGYTNVDIR